MLRDGRWVMTLPLSVMISPGVTKKLALVGVEGSVGVVAGQPRGCTGNTTRRFVAHRCLHACYEGSPAVKTLPV